MQSKFYHGGGASKAGWPDTTAGTITGAANIGGGAEVYKNTVAGVLQLRTLVNGAAITCTQNASDITIATTAEANTMSNVGAGAGLVYKQKTGVNFELKSIAAGTAITVTNNASEITIGTTAEANTMSNVGTGTGNVYKQKTGVNFELKTLKQGANITITDGASDITIAASGGGGGLPEFQYYADQVNTPNTADWKINAFATVSADSVNSAITNRQFDDTLEEGIGFSIEIPATAANIIISPRARAQTAPGVAKQVILKIYNRDIPDNAAVGAWSAGTTLTAIDIPANANFQYDTQTIALATLGMTAGLLTQIELTRNGADGSDTLVGDWNLELLKVTFS